MKNLLIVSLLLVVQNLTYAKAPNFENIFREIKSAGSVSESISIRQRYLSQMRSLEDFDRLTDLEMLNEGEFYFEHYLRELSKFTVDNVNRFMFDRNSEMEQDVFTERIVSKAHGRKCSEELLEKGLFYVEDCDDFESYVRASRAPRFFVNKHRNYYCYFDGANGIGTFELISNLILKEGEYKVLYLPANMFVSKLYISVEGMRGDAYFDVMVNGDIKGTIYAPGRDPLYIVNVSEVASTINLRSLSGQASISSIKIE